MGKEMLKTAGAAAFEKVIESMLPQIIQRLDRLDASIAATETRVSASIAAVESKLSAEISSVRREVFDLRQEMGAKFERTQELINELGLRINTTETKVDTIHEFAYSDAKDIRDRLARVEQVHKFIHLEPRLRLVNEEDPPATSRRKSSRKAR